MKPAVLVASAILSGSIAVLLGAQLQPPLFNRTTGIVPTGFAFSLTNFNTSGAIMFTTDGADPRTPAGTVYTNARALWAPVTVNRTTTVKARVLSKTDWSEPVEATFVTSNDYTKLLITEVMYQPPGTNGATERSREFAEIKNTGTETLDLSGISFRQFSFPTGTVIAPGEFKVLIQNTNAYLLDHPGAIISGRYPLALVNDDSEASLYHASGALLFQMNYLTHGPWPSLPDDHNFTRKGFSLVPRDPNSIPDPDSFRSWRTSAFEGGSPGADDPPETRPYIKLTEILARPDTVGYPYEAMELYNPYPTNVDIGGWFLSDSRPSPRQFHVPPGTIVPANSYLLLDVGSPGTELEFAL